MSEENVPRRGDDFPPPSGKPTGDTGIGGLTTGPHPGTPPQGEGPAADVGGSALGPDDASDDADGPDEDAAA